MSKRSTRKRSGRYELTPHETILLKKRAVDAGMTAKTFVESLIRRAIQPPDKQAAERKS